MATYAGMENIYNGCRTNAAMVFGSIKVYDQRHDCARTFSSAMALCIRRTRTRVMFHVFPVTLQETRATLHETRATLQETPATFQETPATLNEARATLQETLATLQETRATLHAFTSASASASAEYTKPSLSLLFIVVIKLSRRKSDHFENGPMHKHTYRRTYRL